MIDGRYNGRKIVAWITWSPQSFQHYGHGGSWDLLAKLVLREGILMDEFTQHVVDTAARAVATFQERSQDALDYSEGSLAVVDEMLAEASQYVGEMPEEQLSGLVQLLGCYLLEVGRREFGGRYCWHDGRNQPVLVVGEPEYRVAMIAFDKIRGRLLGDQGDNIPFFYDGFAGRARTAKPGTDALYV